uniref:Methyltransferase n=1 Tax=Hirondellea gigas TaxID=1518452 RepID=A0A2R5L0K0_9CRUS
MRIIAGSAKGKIIKCRDGFDTRPTTDRVKESLFSMIAPYISEAVVLDLFSGTGNIALEAISRGAKRAVMIEKEKEALRVIIQNVNNLGFDDRCRAYKNETLRALTILGKKREKFNIIFLDPPYKDNVCNEVIEKISETGILAEGGLIVAEHHILEDMEDVISEFKKVDERRYGKKELSFYTR